MNQNLDKNAFYYLQSLIETSSEAITIIDAAGRVEFWNTFAEQIYGIPHTDITGKKINDFFQKQDLKLFEILETETPVYGTYHQPRPNMHVLISSSPVYDSRNKLIGAISIERNITNTVKLNEKLSLTTSELQKIRQQYNREQRTGPFSEIIGTSVAIEKVRTLSLKVARTDATVFIQGESGVGKELFAQGIHAASLRNEKRFVPINCGAIPAALFESELFGYEKGAFTGADKDGKAGKVEMADGGTLFLDEVGTLPLDMQVKLLRVLQEQEVYRIGSNNARKVDVRVVAATNSDMDNMVQEGKFREDLYYRLNVVTLSIPPLRERISDIPILVMDFMQEFSIKYQKKAPTLSESTINMFRTYAWPGNIRQLRNIVERLIIFIEKPEIEAEDLKDIFPEKRSKLADGGLTQENAVLEKERIKNTLQETFGNKSAAAKKLGISRVSLYKKLKKYEIDM